MYWLPTATDDAAISRNTQYSSDIVLQDLLHQLLKLIKYISDHCEYNV